MARAVKLVRGGRSPAEVASALGMGKSTLYARLKAPEPPKPSKARPGPAKAQEAPPPSVEAAPIPADLSDADADLWILDEEIAATRRQLANMRAAASRGGSTHGLASVGALLAQLVRRRVELRPAPPPTAEEDERRWRADADEAVRLIEAGVVAAQREAKCPHCGRAPEEQSQ